MQSNSKIRKGINRAVNHEQQPAVKPVNNLLLLRRAVLTCLLWENTFYEEGSSIAQRIKELVPKCKKEDVAALAIEARDKYKLRHVSLFLARELARSFRGRLVGDTIYSVINRADELAEFMSMYWAEGKQPLSAQTKIGLARAFRKFDEYQLAKYKRDDKAVRLQDVLFMVHAIPKDTKQEDIWNRLVKDELQTPNTWETRLSAGESKQETFTDLLKTKKMGHMAVLRNLRNMIQAGVPDDLIQQSIILGAKNSKALPFRYISAAKHAVRFEPQLDIAMMLSMKGMPKLPGKTVLLVDVSGSMSWGKISDKSELSAMEAAAALAILVRGVSDNCTVYTFSNGLVEVPARQGMALKDAIITSQSHQGTQLYGAVNAAVTRHPDADRVIVITDEQSTDGGVLVGVKGIGYIMNVASYEYQVRTSGSWIHIDGWSEAAVRFIQEVEDDRT